MKKDAFTLMEMMVVLMVIGILISLSSVTALRILKEAKISQAEADIAAIEAAVSRYERDIGDYPPASNGLHYHLEADRSSDTTGWEGPYMDFDDDRISGNNYEDPWGNNYQYSNPGSNNTGFVDIWSGGSPDPGDDITNW
jgi:general secretion pathway protein G